MKQAFNDFFLTHLQAIQEIFSLLMVITIGTMIKVWKAIKDNSPITFKWFVAELFMSGVVAITGYFVFDKFFNLDKILVYIICAWLGSMSTIFHTKVESLVDFLFEKLKSVISSKTLIILLIAGLFLFISSCGKKPIESTHTIERITTHKRDSVVNREISKAISDSLFVAIGNIKTSKPECDSITNAKIQELLRQISSMKKSGNNELGFYYDEINKKLVAYGKVGQSIDEKIKILNDLLDKTTDKEIKEIPVKYIPKWVQVLAWIGGFSILAFILWICKKLALW